MFTRYAIYLAPPPDSAHWRFGSGVIGYDAVTGEDLPGFAPAGYSSEAWHAATEDPRRYGFHATLKAPFRLAEGESQGSLEAALASFAAAATPFPLGPLAVTALSRGGDRGFVAMTQTRASAELAALERETVRHFDRFRAPFGEAELAQPKFARLDAEERANLLRWGYPHVGERFRFHMTLSGLIEGCAAVADSLAEETANRIGTVSFDVEALVLFGQRADTGRFRTIGRFALG